MRAIRNILWLIVGLLLGCITVLAHAEGSVGPPAVQYSPMTWIGAGIVGPTPPEVCSKYKDRADAASTPPEWDSPPTDVNRPAGSGAMFCFWKIKDRAEDGFQMGGSCPTGMQMDLAHPTPYGYRCKTGVQCPTGSTLTNGECICNAGLKPNGNKCEAPKCTSEASFGSSGVLPTLPRSGQLEGGSFGCKDGCRTYFRPSKSYCPSHTAIVNGVQKGFCHGQWEFLGNGDGDVCTEGQGANGAPSPPTPNPPPDSCGSGQGMIKVDGVTRCINTSTGKDESTKPPPAPTEETKNTTQTSTTDPGTGKTTVTTTTTNTGTGGTTTVTETYGPGVTPGTGIPPISVTTGTTGGGASGEAGDGDDDDGDGQTDCDKHPDSLACEKMGTPTQLDNVSKPTLYEAEYPDGLQGVWDARKAEMMAGAMGQLITKFTTVPSVGNASCPSFAIPTANLMGVTVGGDISPPCWIWPVIKSILIITALFVARGLIFGG